MNIPCARCDNGSYDPPARFEPTGPTGVCAECETSYWGLMAEIEVHRQRYGGSICAVVAEWWEAGRA